MCAAAQMRLINVLLGLTLVFFVECLILTTYVYGDGRLMRRDVFAGFFPCVPDSVNMSTQEDAQSCDLFVYAAVQLALDQVELESDQRRELSEIVTGQESGNSEHSNVNEVLYNLYVEISRKGRKFPEFLSLIRGAIGTDDNYAHGVPSTSFSERIGIPIVSYGLADNRLDKYSIFHRTIPSTLVLNQARLTLLHRFKWYRIGILGSAQKSFNYQMESFREYFNRYVERQDKAELSYEGTTNEIHLSLLELHRLDIRIIVGFFGPEEMRMVLCKASQYNLTTPDHVWILLSYYNPDWWKRNGAGYYSNQQTNNCSDEQMIDILNSVIFLDPVKYPPLGIPLSKFYPSLLNKTKELFFQLSPEVNLESLLQHSRAVSAYDSTLLLARSLIDGRVDRDKLHSVIVCELCRIYPEQFLPPHNLQFCRKILPLCDDSAVSNDSLQHTQNISRGITLAAYGQVLISQFINGNQCPMVLFWPTESIHPEDLIKNYVDMITLSNFSGQLELDPKIVFPNFGECTQNFYWKGRDSPPSSNNLLTSSVPVWALVFVGVATGLSEMLMVFFMVFSIVWRKNIYVKSTSPRVNVVMLFGAALHILYPLLLGIIISGDRYGLDKLNGTILCQLRLWMPWIGYTLIMAGLATKVFRLYKIFRNTSLRVNLNYLSDQKLIISAIVLVIPVVIVLLVWTAIPDTRFKYHVDNIENGKIQYVQVTSCHGISKLQYVFDVLIRIYVAMIFVTALCLSLLITGTPKSIKIDLSMTRAALGVGFVTFVIAISSGIVVDSLSYEIAWWFQVLDVVFGATIVMTLLISYQVVLVVRDYKKKKCRKKWKYPTHVDVESYYQSLLEKISELSNSLQKKETRIRQLKKPEHAIVNES